MAEKPSRSLVWLRGGVPTPERWQHWTQWMPDMTSCALECCGGRTFTVWTRAVSAARRTTAGLPLPQHWNHILYYLLLPLRQHVLLRWFTAGVGWQRTAALFFTFCTFSSRCSFFCSSQPAYAVLLRLLPPILLCLYYHSCRHSLLFSLFWGWTLRWFAGWLVQPHAYFLPLTPLHYCHPRASCTHHPVASRRSCCTALQHFACRLVAQRAVTRTAHAFYLLDGGRRWRLFSAGVP